MFTKRYRPSISLIGGAAIALLAVTGFGQEANAQQPIRSNITPRSVRSNLVPTTNIRSNLLAPSVQDQLSVIAEELGTTVETLLQDQQIAEIAQSPVGADVLNSLVEADGITGTAPNFEVDSGEGGTVPVESPEAVSVLPVESPAGASVENTLSILDADEE
jgi:hypothetical protein